MDIRLLDFFPTQNQAREFTAITDNLNRQSTDPLVIQPTTVEEVRIRKKQIEEELVSNPNYCTTKQQCRVYD